MSMEQHGMDDEAREQIQSLKDALDVALGNSFEVANAIDVLRRCGRQVQIEIDAVLIDENNASDSTGAASSLEPAGAQPLEPGGTSIFSADDALFLQSMRISPA